MYPEYSIYPSSLTVTAVDTKPTCQKSCIVFFLVALGSGGVYDRKDQNIPPPQANRLS